MMRKHLLFSCEGQTLAGTLDQANGTTGLLIVSGGNEIRAGAFSGQAQLADEIARAGWPVFRFDRRGVGDSEGTNASFRGSGPDIASALAAFRDNAPHIRRIVGLGICDAASALILNQDIGFDALILANPWVLDDDNDTAPPPPAAIRARYIQKLRNPGEWRRLLTGAVSPIKLFRGLMAASRPSPAKTTQLAGSLQAELARYSGAVRILIAERDRTAQIFEANWPRKDARIARCPNASHAFAEPDAKLWLYNKIVDEITAQTD